MPQREEETALAAHQRAQGLDGDPSLQDGDFGGSYEMDDEVVVPAGAALAILFHAMCGIWQ